MSRQDVVVSFLAQMLAESAVRDPNDLAEEHVKNDARLARGEHKGKIIAEALRRAELES